MDCVWHVTTRNDLHLKLVFFDFDVRLTDACSEADFVEVKTGGSLLKVYNCVFLTRFSISNCVVCYEKWVVWSTAFKGFWFTRTLSHSSPRASMSFGSRALRRLMSLTSINSQVTRGTILFLLPFLFTVLFDWLIDWLIDWLRSIAIDFFSHAYFLITAYPLRFNFSRSWLQQRKICNQIKRMRDERALYSNNRRRFDIYPV